MSYLILLLVIAAYIICKLLIDRKRVEKQKIEFDAFIVQSAIKIMSDIKDLEEEKLNLIFEKGSVYYEAPEKLRECLLKPIRTLSDEENKKFAELVYNSLSKENLLSVTIKDADITISKSNKDGI